MASAVPIARSSTWGTASAVPIAPPCVERTLVMRVTALIAAVMTVALGVSCSRFGMSRTPDAAPEMSQQATLNGCVVHGYEPSDVLLVAVGDVVASSSTVDIAWQGTRQYHLVVPQHLRDQVRFGQRVIATGTIVDPPGREPSRVDQEQMADGMRFREFRATALQPTEGVCRASAEFGRDAADSASQR